jgi:hypothetical protein
MSHVVRVMGAPDVSQRLQRRLVGRKQSHNGADTGVASSARPARLGTETNAG